MTDTAKGEFKKAMHVGRLTADKVQLGTAGGYEWQNYPGAFASAASGTLPTASLKSFRYRVVGTVLEIKFDINYTSNTGGIAPTGTMVFAFPPGCIPKQTSIGFQYGVGSLTLLGSVVYGGEIFVQQVGPPCWGAYLSTNGVANVLWGNTSPADTKWTAATMSVGGRLVVELDPSSPILGEAPVQLSNGTGSVLSTVYAGSNNGSLITGQFQ